MNTSKSINPIKTVYLVAVAMLISIQSAISQSSETDKPAEKQIFLALLLDTSSSMDGLIDQAKSQLWNVVDELADAKHDGKPARLNIALYEYGNDGLSVTSDYIRQVTRFTTDLDEISAKLFSLRTNGGSEFCGSVIKHSLNELQWSNNPDDLQLVFIAGNEPFNQGTVGFENQCINAQKANIQVNTIFCGNYQEGIDGLWKKGADLGGGKYLNIDMDQKTVYVVTPYDQKIDKLNDLLNDTYLAYGAIGQMKKAQQLQEDLNASSFSRSNKVKRAISKSKHVYKNEQWDLVDAYQEGSLELESIPQKELPEEMTEMNLQEKEAYIVRKGEQRSTLQTQIQELGVKRSVYIKAYNDSLSVENPLEYAILESVKEAATKKQFKFQ